MKKIGLLGATGSIGRQTIDIVTDHPEFSVDFFSVHQNIGALDEIFKQTRASYAIVTHEESFLQAKKTSEHKLYGPQDLVGLLEASEADILLNAMVGTAGMSSTYTWLKAGRTLALANKESLVSAGHVMTELLKTKGGVIHPVDSEHSALWQSLQGQDRSSVSKLILTASGGAFRDLSKEEIRHKKASDALKHPNWSMGSKITIDSATLINKGLEVLEAKWLFDVPLENIEVLVHRESIVHSMVEYTDGAVMAQLGTPDMKLPILYALSYPKRLETHWPKLDLLKVKELHFEPVDEHRFHGIRLAKKAMKKGGNMPLVLNVYNELYVKAYLEGAIGFYDITEGIEEALEKTAFEEHPSIESLLALEQEIIRKGIPC